MLRSLRRYQILGEHRRVSHLMALPSELAWLVCSSSCCNRRKSSSLRSLLACKAHAKFPAKQPVVRQAAIFVITMTTLQISSMQVIPVQAVRYVAAA